MKIKPGLFLVGGLAALVIALGVWRAVSPVPVESPRSEKPPSPVPEAQSTTTLKSKNKESKATPEAKRRETARKDAKRFKELTALLSNMYSDRSGELRKAVKQILKVKDGQLRLRLFELALSSDNWRLREMAVSYLSSLKSSMGTILAAKALLNEIS